MSYDRNRTIGDIVFKRMAAVLVIVAAMAAVLALSACGGPGEKAETGGGGVTAPTLEQFFDADAKTSEFTVQTVMSTGESVEMTGTLWVDGRKFRYDLYDNGKLVRAITSPDGETAYFVQHDEKICEPSVASVDRYLLEFSEPSADAVEDGTDEQTGAKRIRFEVNRMDNVEGSANPWFTKDVVYLVKGEEVIGVITRGDSTKDPAESELDVSRRMFSGLKVGVPIPADTFELPYPIKAAQ